MDDNQKQKVTEKPNPVVLSINICDNIIRDEVTKKVSLIGLFGVIKANVFPCIHPLMNVHIVLTNGHGQYKTVVRFVNLSDGNLIAGMEGVLPFQNPLQVVELVICWQRLKFDKQGEYVVEVLCDNKQVGSRKFQVIGPELKVLPTMGTEV